MKTINITLFSLENQKITEAKENRFELHEDHFRHYMEFRADEPAEDSEGNVDKMLEWKQQHTCLIVSIPKKNIIGIELNLNKNKAWCLSIVAPGFEVKSYFKIKQTGEDVFNDINNWLCK